MSSGRSTPLGIEILELVQAKALADPAYRARLIADPKAVLRAEGIAIDDDLKVVIHENTADTVNLVLPVRLKHPSELRLLECDLGVIADHTGGI
jgi:hypothetical protein